MDDLTPFARIDHKIRELTGLSRPRYPWHPTEEGHIALALTVWDHTFRARGPTWEDALTDLHQGLKAFRSRSTTLN